MDETPTVLPKGNIYVFILYKAIKHKEISLLELAVKTQLGFNIDTKRFNEAIRVLKNKGLITVEERVKEEFKKCLEEKAQDKRVKDPRKYCLRQYPIEFIIRATELGKIEYTHMVYCLSYELDKSRETALRNFKDAMEWADIGTIPPDPNYCRRAWWK